jgi:hypothetical protein
MSNTKIWDALGQTNPAHTKGFQRSGGFRGTAVKPMWVFSRLTEEFGPCGVGWGMDEPSFQVVPSSPDILVFCTVRCWFEKRENGFYGVGGDKCASTNRNGHYIDDEAFKKAFTDAIMNAFKFIGVAADVHMGLFDDSKYVEEAKKAYAEPRRDMGPGEVDTPDWWGSVDTGMTAHAAKRAGLDDVHEQMRLAIDQLHTAEDWKNWCADNSDQIKTMPRAWRQILRSEAEERGRFLGAIND